MGSDRTELAEAEASLFARLDLGYRRRELRLADAPVARAGVIEAGEGPPVLLVHGAGMTAAIWAPLMAALPDRRLLAVDLPGCGLTDRFDYRDVDLPRHARSFLVALLDALEIASLPVVANSLGAMYALHLAAAEPERVTELLLMGAPGVAFPGSRASVPMALYSRPALGRLLGATTPPMRPGMVRRVLGTLCGRGAVEHLPHEMFAVVAAAMRVSEPTTRSLMPELLHWRTPREHTAIADADLAAIAVPTVMVWGADDRFQGPAAGERACRVMPDASLVVLPGGHHPWWDDPDRCAELVRQRAGTDVDRSGPT